RRWETRRTITRVTGKHGKSRGTETHRVGICGSRRKRPAEIQMRPRLISETF
ncbi:hypothetical protein DPEC_G00082760, partial [Dallia pectoralis]